MEVILLERVLNLGELGDRVRVKPGYARNFLIPQNKAVPANEANIAEFESRKEELRKAQEESLAAAQARAEKLVEVSVTLTAQATTEGKLFGSIGPREIAEAVTAAGFELERAEVDMPEGPVRQIGEYQIGVVLHPDVRAEVAVAVAVEE